MSAKRLIALFGLGIVFLSVLSGPLFWPIDFTTTGPGPTDGNATVEVESVPAEGFTLEQGRFGAGRYHLVAPPAVVHVGQIEGNPILRYSIDIPGLNSAISSRYEGTEMTAGRMELQFPPVGISPEKIEQRRYEAVVSIWLHAGTRQINLRYQEVVIEVEP